LLGLKGHKAHLDIQDLQVSFYEIYSVQKNLGPPGPPGFNSTLDAKNIETLIDNKIQIAKNEIKTSSGIKVMISINT
jgi:hypothetical protein